MTYIYVCSCGVAVELIRLASERNNRTVCTSCGEDMTRTIESPPPVHYHGIGFAHTPSILKDQMAAGAQDKNWGAEDKKQYGGQGE